MKFLQMLCIFVFSFLIFVVGFSYLRKSDKNDVSSYDSSVSMAESVSQNSSDISSFEESSQSTAQAVTDNFTQLDGQTITWGPGNRFDDLNRSETCVALQEKYGDLDAVFLKNDDTIYLTFDLGYEAGYTHAILDVLKQRNVQATFFVTGSYAKNNEEIISRIIAEGHVVGNHSATHPNMTTISQEDALDEIMTVHQIMQEKYNYSPYLFRFPEGAFSEKTLALVKDAGYKSVFWSFAYNDWDNNLQPEYQSALDKTTERLHGGIVYLFHPMKTNSEILSQLILNAKNQHYEFGVL